MQDIYVVLHIIKYDLYKYTSQYESYIENSNISVAMYIVSNDLLIFVPTHLSSFHKHAWYRPLENGQLEPLTYIHILNAGVNVLERFVGLMISLSVAW